MNKIIYRLSTNPNYGYFKKSNSWLQVNEQLDTGELYLFREVWKLDDYDLNNPYREKISDNYIKIVNNDWIKKHTTAPNYIEFYGCRVLKDYESYTDYESCIPTQYDQEINNIY